MFTSKQYRIAMGRQLPSRSLNRHSLFFPNPPQDFFSNLSSPKSFRSPGHPSAFGRSFKVPFQHGHPVPLNAERGLPGLSVSCLSRKSDPRCQDMLLSSKAQESAHNLQPACPPVLSASTCHKRKAIIHLKNFSNAVPPLSPYPSLHYASFRRA